MYYNLGNATIRADKPGMAVVSYERALRLDPSGDDIRTNLEFVRSHIADKPEDDTAFFASLHRSVVCAMSANAWAWTAFRNLCAAYGGDGNIYLLSTNIVLRKVRLLRRYWLHLCMVPYVLLVASDSKERATSHDDAVVIVPNTPADVGSPVPAPRCRQGRDNPRRNGCRSCRFGSYTRRPAVADVVQCQDQQQHKGMAPLFGCGSVV